MSSNQIGTIKTATNAVAEEWRVIEEIEVDASPEDVWAILKDYQNINNWHPAIAKSKIVEGVNNIIGAVRLLTLMDGSVVSEKLLAYDPKSKTLEYSIVESQLPLSHYTSKMSILPGLQGNTQSLIMWKGNFRSKNLTSISDPSQDDAAAMMTVKAIYTSGLNNIKAIFVEQNLIRKIIGYYAEGGTVGDSKKVASAFHPSATMKFIKDENLVNVPIQDFFTAYIKAGVKQQRTIEIDQIDIRGTAASAKLTIDYLTHQFIDYFNLLKINGQWLIVSKIFHRIDK